MMGSHPSFNAWGGSVLLGLLVTLLACTPVVPPSPTLPAGNQGQAEARQPRGALKIAYAREPESASSKFLGGGGAGEYAWIFNSTLTMFDFNGIPHPLLASEIPSREKGDWVVNPDGTMVTTYRLRPGARWHDSVPITAGDFVFAHQVYLDPELPVVTRSPEDLMSRVDAPDDQTVVIYWRETFPSANVLGYQQLNPLPRHILEAKYRTNRANFTIGEEWTTSYIGSGPFRVERWEPGARIVTRAHREWVLGPPRLETLEIRFISDNATMLGNLLASEIDMTTALSIGQALEADRWVARGEGYLKTWSTRLTFLDFQQREVPNWQPAMRDVRVRQALMHSLDREGLVDAINHGLGGVAHAFITPSDPLFPDADQVITKYPLDPSRAAALLGEAGWRRSQPGAPFADAAGQALKVDIWSTEEKEALLIADSWRTAGINSSPYGIPQARQRDLEHRNSFPGANTGSRSIHRGNFDWTSKGVPKPETGWVGSNRGSFVDAEIDRLYEVWTTSIIEPERRQAQIALYKRMSELVAIGPIFYGVEVILASNKVKGPVGNYGPQVGVTWNVHEWEVTE